MSVEDCKTINFIFLVFFATAVIFTGLGSYPLINPDEGRNAEVAREIVDYGHWLPPTLAGKIRYEKPPLFYWAVALSFKVFGKSEFAARFVSAFSALVCIVIIFTFGRKIEDAETGLTAGFILSSTLIFLAFAKLVIFDMLLTTLIVIAIYFFWLSEIENKKFFLFVSALFCSLSVLTKGPIGLIISSMALLPFSLFQRKRMLNFTVWILISLIASIPVFLIIELKSPGYCYKFFWIENVLRYLTPISKREKPVYYYVFVFLIGFVPWSIITPTFIYKIKTRWKENRETITMLLCWATFPFIFFTFSKAKMPQYVLPAFPAWALILATAIEDVERQVYEKVAVFSGVVMLILFVALLPRLAEKRSMKGVEKILIAEKNLELVNFKTKDYTAMFYTGIIVPKIRNTKIMCEFINRKKKVYIITKKTKLDDLTTCNVKLKIVGKFNKFLLLKAIAPSLKDHLPAREPEQDEP